MVIVSYDLNRPGQKWSQVDEAMRALKGGRVLETVWLLPGNSVKPASAAIDAIADANDKYVVFVLTPSDGFGCGGLSQEWRSWIGASL